MGIAADIEAEGGWHAALAALAWQVDLGVAEAIGEGPVNCYDLPAEAPWGAKALRSATAVAAAPRDTAGPAVRAPLAVPGAGVGGDPVAIAQAAARSARDLDGLRAALAGFEHCEIKRGARNLVFADGLAGARVLILGEAPGRDEDLEGRPFVGAAGQLLDRMFASIGLNRTSADPAQALYITNVLPWRPPQNRDPTPDEIAMMRPFVARHIELANPEIVVLMGNTPLAAVLQAKGILRMRGQWAEALGRPVLPMTHPAYLLRQPLMKREAWADLLSLQERLRR